MRAIELALAIAAAFFAFKWFAAELAGRGICEILQRHGIDPSEAEIKAACRVALEKMFRIRK